MNKMQPPPHYFEKIIMHEIIHEIFQIYFFFQQKKYVKSILDIFRKHKKTPYIKKNSWRDLPPYFVSALQANTIARLVRSLKFSYYSQKPPRLHLFLGETLDIDTVQCQWGWTRSQAHHWSRVISTNLMHDIWVSHYTEGPSHFPWVSWYYTINSKGSICLLVM